MAQIVAALGVPHTPGFPALVEREGPEGETARLFAAMRVQLKAARPDLAIMYSTDHLNTFFFDHLPIFAIGEAECFEGPNDEVPALPPRQVRSDAVRARDLRRACVEVDFDVGAAQEFGCDHSFLVPIHFLLPEELPVIPIFLSGHLPPLPSARRCLALGEAIARAIRSWTEPRRVAIIGTGSFSLDVHGTQIAPGKAFGVPDPAWAERACLLIAGGEVEQLVAEASPEQLRRAGNVAGEILNWIAMLGATEGRPADAHALQAQFGHAYAAWRLP